mmetsp:Transcript_27122/g.81344  ORF Transcript_27122/g.81344 Transcript_27122/m.81344 type:complete len:245 (-) Transcript_27122:433-1167(-)
MGAAQGLQALGAHAHHLLVHPHARLVLHARGLLARALPAPGAPGPLPRDDEGRHEPPAHRRGGPQVAARRQRGRGRGPRRVPRGPRGAHVHGRGQEGRRRHGARGRGRSVSGGLRGRGVVLVRAGPPPGLRAQRHGLLLLRRLVGLRRGGVRRAAGAHGFMYCRGLDAVVAPGRRREDRPQPAAHRDVPREGRLRRGPARRRVEGAPAPAGPRGRGRPGVHRLPRRARAVEPHVRRRLRQLPRL